MSTLAKSPNPERFAIAPDIEDLFVMSARRKGILAWTRRRPKLVLGMVLLAVIFMVAVFAPLLGTIDPTALQPIKRSRPPSFENWFGTDMLGRDLYSRVLYGTRVSLIVGCSVAVVASVGGLALGLIAGYVKYADGLIMRVCDCLMSIPSILLAITLMSLTRASITNVIIAISIAEIARVSRLVRGVVLSLREQSYIDAAIASGTGTGMIIVRHLLPNALAPITVQATYIWASAMITEAILSFIGAGTPPVTPSWGNIMSDGRSLWQVAPYAVFEPAMALSLTVLAVNLVGDGLRDLLDTRLVKEI